MFLDKSVLSIKKLIKSIENKFVFVSNLISKLLSYQDRLMTPFISLVVAETGDWTPSAAGSN